ncbi:hypothetical protein ACTFIY_008687 [Dictyostelium cf. discoideum]
MSFCDSFSKYRESLGLPSTCINLGSIESTGFVSKNESILVFTDGIGLLDLQIQNAGKFTNSMRTGNKNINELFIDKVSELFSTDESRIYKNLRLIDYGADSLIIVQLKNWIDKEIGTSLITIQQIQNNAINISIKMILNSLIENNQNIDDNKPNENKIITRIGNDD